MLYYDSLHYEARQLVRDRERDGFAERLVLEARSQRRRRARRSILPMLGRVLAEQRQAVAH